MEIFVIMMIACAVIGYFIDNVRGAVLGGLLGVIGLVISAVLVSGEK